ncbi:Hypothetical predicted protein [Marmota monax]|uniref:Cadherin domain-containing protein n=1 Tax=Marmota monax TaxID=9995 RepID=A0A5E4DF88_MARMO|nr:Hypothetical predicted protein [Marmota monax]
MCVCVKERDGPSVACCESPLPSVDQAAQEAVPPADIVFSVKSPPSAGYLVMVSHGASVDEPPRLDPVHSFPQEAVDAGLVLYLHSRPEAWRDTFSLDVTSGLGAPLEGILMELEVLPTAIPLEAQNFSVPEGGTRTLAPPLLRVTGPYFPTLPSLNLQVLEPPQHGALQREEQAQDGTLSTFSWKEVQLSGRPRGCAVAHPWAQSEEPQKFPV